MSEYEEREEKLRMIARKIQESGLSFPDIRDREWSKIDSDAATLLNYLVQAENIFVGLDEYQMENGQCYPEIEDMMLQISNLREKYTNFVDKNLDILKVNLK